MRVLVTGAAGRLGRRLAPTLERDHELVLGDTSPLDDQRFLPLDVCDLEAARVAVRGCDAVVHMAILDWRACGTEDTLRQSVPAIRVHVVGLHNMLHAAWEVGVRKFIYISTVSAVDGLPPGTVVGSDTRHYSNTIYGMTKGFGEDLCRMFHCSLGLSIAVLRLGTLFIPEADGTWVANVFVPNSGKQPSITPGASGVHVDDVTRAVSLALEASDPGYCLVHVVGADSGAHWDLKAAREAFGWEPRYAFGSDGLPHPRSVDPP
jgi:uronate dehydrogenase